jgi:hypothetical protein
MVDSLTKEFRNRFVMRASISRFLVAICLMLTSVQSWAEMEQAWIIESGDFKETIVSTNPTEKDQLTKDGWKIDGTGMMRTAWEAGAGPLHRLSQSTATGVDRVLETDVRQLPVLQKSGYVDEGLVGFVADSDGPGRIPVIQFSKGNRKLWVVSEEAQVILKKEGWIRQGIHFWLWPLSAK